MNSLLKKGLDLNSPCFIFITGGTLSSLGKGLSAAALGALLKDRGYKVRLRKLDPYLNVDPGTMSPLQHGEVFVTKDGTECDLDFGHYERFTEEFSDGRDTLTSGSLYESILKKERAGGFLGQTVQVIPHVTNGIKEFLTHDVQDKDFVICEIGGTVGDIEGLPYLEAIRQLRNDLGSQQTLFIHVVWIPYVPMAKELKTKPAQHSVKELQRSGIQPDILLCRCDRSMGELLKAKLALLCNTIPENIIEARDFDNIYKVPLGYSQAGLDRQVLKHFGQSFERDAFGKAIEPCGTSCFEKENNNSCVHHQWHNIHDQIAAMEQNGLSIGLVGKYDNFTESYKSLNEALFHGGMVHKTQVNLVFIDGEILEGKTLEECGLLLQPLDALVIPGGFGDRGCEGKIQAIHWARLNRKPILGICLGLQLMVIEFCRNVLGLKEANSSEFGITQDLVIGQLSEWMQGDQLQIYRKEDGLGGTMRLGSYPCQIALGTKTQEIYQETFITERHRHRYEVNNHYRKDFEKAGLKVSGVSPDGALVEIIEYSAHPWFVGVQFHPELQSTPLHPHPLFVSLVGEALKGLLLKSSVRD
jgi:CTP synthase